VRDTHTLTDRLLGALVSVSSNMTGAEIEAAINAALYEAYDIDRKCGGATGGRLTPELLVRVVNEGQERSLYNGGAGGALANQINDAARRGWLDADFGGRVPSPVGGAKG